MWLPARKPSSPPPTDWAPTLESKGLPSVRANVAAYIAARDGGDPADKDAVFLTNGASDSVKNILEMLVRGPTDGVMVPTPQYPLYSAALTIMGARRVSYGLLEAEGWGVGVDDWEAAHAAAVAEGTTVRALVVINPGNPTGKVLSLAGMEDLVRFRECHTLVLMADEVYQVNVYAEGKAFTSFKRVVQSLGSPVELVSFHSTSKGMIGECGLRGGSMEVVNFHPHAMDVFYKAASVSLCSSIPGQAAMDVMVKPPVEGEPSFALYKQEMDATYDALRCKTAKLASVLNTLPGIHATGRNETGRAVRKRAARRDRRVCRTWVGLWESARNLPHPHYLPANRGCDGTDGQPDARLPSELYEEIRGGGRRVGRGTCGEGRSSRSQTFGG